MNKKLGRGGDRLAGSYSNDTQQDKQTKQEQQQQKVNEQRRQTETPHPAFVHAAQLLQSGAKLRDLLPEEAREVAAAIGNQAVLQLLNGGKPIPLAPAPPGRGTEQALPETEVSIRWPILIAPPHFARNGPLPESVFPIDRFVPMGRQAGSGVIPDG